MSGVYWITIAAEADSLDDAEALARRIVRERTGRVVQVDAEPPQGSTIVGPMHEDEVTG